MELQTHTHSLSLSLTYTHTHTHTHIPLESIAALKGSVFSSLVMQVDPVPQIVTPSECSWLKCRNSANYFYNGQWRGKTMKFNIVKANVNTVKCFLIMESVRSWSNLGRRYKGCIIGRT